MLHMFPRIDQATVPFLTTEQMVEVDRAMIEDFQILLIQMMENAGRNLAQVARLRFLSGDPRGKRVAVLAGVGGNGGGALVCARRLANWGASVEVFVSKPRQGFTEVPGHQFDVVRSMNIPSVTAAPKAEASYDLVIDGIIGYSLRGAPRGAAADMIRWTRTQSASVLALDTPTGVDASSGSVLDPAIRATATMALALPKEGLRAESARAHVGELYLADISVPPALYAEPFLRLQVSAIFSQSEIVRLV